MIGDDAAPTYFQINANDGRVTIQRELSSDDTTDYQVSDHWSKSLEGRPLSRMLRLRFDLTPLQARILVRDGGTPSKTETTILGIHVNRNNFAPRFPSPNYKTTILETQALGVSIIQVQAEDQDTRVPYNILSYVLLGNSNITNYFMVDAMTGEVSLKKSLMDDPFKVVTYRVRAGEFNENILK